MHSHWLIIITQCNTTTYFSGTTVHHVLELLWRKRSGFAEELLILIEVVLLLVAEMFWQIKYNQAVNLRAPSQCYLWLIFSAVSVHL